MREPWGEAQFVPERRILRSQLFDLRQQGFNPCQQGRDQGILLGRRKRGKIGGRRHREAHSQTASRCNPNPHPEVPRHHTTGRVGTSACRLREAEQLPIERLVIEKVSGHVVYAITTFGGLLSVGAEKHTIPWEQLHFDTMLGGYKTSITENQL